MIDLNYSDFVQMCPWLEMVDITEFKEELSYLVKGSIMVLKSNQSAQELRQ